MYPAETFDAELVAADASRGDGYDLAARFDALKEVLRKEAAGSGLRVTGLRSAVVPGARSRPAGLRLLLNHRGRT